VILMLGFILSKMNLLILVTALFSIIVFFMFSLNESFIIQKSNEVADNIASQVISLINSPSHCSKNIIVIPKELSFLTGRKTFYKLQIKKIELSQTNDITTFALEFTLVDRKKEDKVFASTRINVKAKEINLYDVDVSGNEVNTNESKDSIFIDPQKVTPIDAFVLVKEIIEGNPYIFVIPCTSSGGNCKLNADAVAGAFNTEESLKSKCIAYST